MASKLPASSMFLIAIANVRSGKGMWLESCRLGIAKVAVGEIEASFSEDREIRECK